MATIIKDGIVIQKDLDTVAQARKNHPDCTVVEESGICGQLYDAKTKKFSDPEPIVDDVADAKREIEATDRKMPRPLEDMYDMLLAKQLITSKDIPLATAKLLNQRKAIRSRIK